MTELLITSKVPGKLIYWRVPYMIRTVENPNDEIYWAEDYHGQGFWAPVSDRIWKVEINMRREGSPGDITLELWECGGDGIDDKPSVKLADLATKEASDVPTSLSWVTFECFENSPILEKGKKYAVVVHAYRPDYQNAYYISVLHNIRRDDGQEFHSADGSSWTRMQFNDLEMKIWFGREFRVEDKGFSEAYLLRIEYLEDGTEITVDGEITFRGDAGEIDILPTAILIPFKKITYESGQVKIFGVGIP